MVQKQPTRKVARQALQKIDESGAAEIELLFARDKPAPVREVEIKNPLKPGQTPVRIRHEPNFAFQPKDPDLPKGFERIGGLPVQITPRGPVVPDIRRVPDYRLRRPWQVNDWNRWFTWTLNNCLFVPAKPARVEIPVLPLTRMCKISSDCARIFTVSDSGLGCVINVVTESVEAGFTVQADPSASYPGDLPAAPLVHPFTKGGINNKYKRLYVPASFYTQARVSDWGGFYVAVVDIDPTSATYLQTVDWIECGWIPEEVAFTDDEEVGVIANYMQGTVTIFQASDGSLLAPELDCFAGAGAGGGGPFARSVRCANVPGLGNRAFVTLTSSTPLPGIAIIDLDDPAYPRTNFSISGFNDGIAVTPEKDRVLVLSSGAQLHVVRVDVDPPVLESTIALPNSDGQSYFGGIAVRPSGNLVFAATGSANSTSPTQGTSLVMANYDAGWDIEMPENLASQVWGVEIASFGNPLKPHLIICSLSGMLTIVPC